MGSAQYPGQPLSILFLWHLSPQINNSKVCAGKACMDTRNYNTNSALGIYTPASPRIYGARELGREKEREEERLIMLAKVISSMGEIVRL